MSPVCTECRKAHRPSSPPLKAVQELTLDDIDRMMDAFTEAHVNNVWN
jgi:hypothetical protein